MHRDRQGFVIPPETVTESIHRLTGRRVRTSSTIRGSQWAELSWHDDLVSPPRLSQKKASRRSLDSWTDFDLMAPRRASENAAPTQYERESPSCSQPNRMADFAKRAQRSEFCSARNKCRPGTSPHETSILQVFREGERRDSNPRPPRPQHFPALRLVVVCAGSPASMRLLPGRTPVEWSRFLWGLLPLCCHPRTGPRRSPAACRGPHRADGRRW
jgi:hypothetical protein